jgi:hypothetical protein
MALDALGTLHGVGDFWTMEPGHSKGKEKDYDDDDGKYGGDICIYIYTYTYIPIKPTYILIY